MKFTRRTMVGLGAALIAAGDSWRSAPAAAAGAARGARKSFLNLAEMSLLDELSEILIPTDEHSPGAREAQVAKDLDLWLGILASTAVDEQKQRPQTFRQGLKAINDLARKAHKKVFMACTPEERVALVAGLAAAEKKKTTVAEKFFGELKRAVAHSYYTSEIGIHKEIGYRGNQVLETYVGYRPDEPLKLPNDREEPGW